MDEEGIAALVATIRGSHGDSAPKVLARRIAELTTRGDHEWAAIWTVVRQRIVGDTKA